MRPHTVQMGRQLQRIGGIFIVVGILGGGFAAIGGGLVLLCLGRGAVYVALTLP